jgi:hypothetical protein
MPKTEDWFKKPEVPDLNIINKENNIVPEKTIIMVPHPDSTIEDAKKSVDVLRGNVKRNWFGENFYRCLPLNIGNQYGFVVKTSYDMTLLWNGQNHESSLIIKTGDDFLGTENHPVAALSHFGYGVLTLSTKFHFRTPPGVNLMTINPPNFLLPGLQNLTGVVETDNLRRDFTINIRVTSPYTEIRIPAGTPVVGVIPIPRYYADKFDVIGADELFSEDLIEKEQDIVKEFYKLRSSMNNAGNKNPFDRLYANGFDIYGNEFPDHQKIKD